MTKITELLQINNNTGLTGDQLAERFTKANDQNVKFEFIQKLLH